MRLETNIIISQLASLVLLGGYYEITCFKVNVASGLWESSGESEIDNNDLEKINVLF